MPRFTVKDLLIATALVALGAGTLAFLFQIGKPLQLVAPPVFAGLWLCGGACVGAGIFTPFKLPTMGGVIGFVIQVLILAILMR
jgi:hypothetical protein